MSEAMNIFMNSYLKKMRRPELGEGFAPDQAFGANMAHGSESINPSAIRDTTNAQYGIMKSPLQQGIMGNITGTGGVSNVPFSGGAKNPLLAQAVGDTTRLVAPKFLSDWATDKIRDMLNKPSSEFAASISQTPTDPMTLFEPAKYDVAGGMGGYEKAGDSFANVPKPSEALTANTSSGSILEGINPSDLATSGALAAAPTLARTITGSKTAGDVVGAGTAVGTAAAQGGLNPISDVAAALSLYKLIRGIF